MNDASILENYRAAMVEVTLLEKQIDRLEAMTGPAGLGAAGGAEIRRTNMREAAIEQQLRFYMNELDRRREALSREMVCAEEVLRHVRNWRSAVVLRGMFLVGTKAARLAEQLGVSARQVYRIRNAAMTTLRQRHTCEGLALRGAGLPLTGEGGPPPQGGGG